MRYDEGPGGVNDAGPLTRFPACDDAAWEWQGWRAGRCAAIGVVMERDRGASRVWEQLYHGMRSRLSLRHMNSPRVKRKGAFSMD